MNIQSFLSAFKHILALLIPFLMALALLYFFWGLAVFIFKVGDEKAIEEGKSKMVWGVIALFVMLSVWGLVGFLQDNLIGGPGTSQIPIKSVALPASSDTSSNTSSNTNTDEPAPCTDSCGY